MIECIPENVGIEFVEGKRISELKYDFAINGTFFDTKRPELSKSCWQVAVDEGIPIGENAFTNSYKGFRRGTMIYFASGKILMDRFNNITEISKLGEIKWAVGGNSLYPDYNLKLEGAFPDIERFAPHTIMALTKDRKILLITTKENRTLTDARNELLKEFNLISAINLDGGGSASMLADGKIIKDHERRLNNMIYVKN